MPTKDETLKHAKDNHKMLADFMESDFPTGLDYLMDRTVQNIDLAKRIEAIEKRLDNLENHDSSSFIIKPTQNEIDFYSRKH